ncbi:hypothetical protein KBB96_04260 [Luteolibacter ambystomatis]|uniref:DUF2306 domain-containing protein n=1 Tax=Luteolibacter ambystomatis TaxID=2824561 RepID=A0A975PG95_9BACT|nr:hypothetical protein [Luteolibacter ambystomatis]QUE52107.1 hypothetical protein KBB96_04260 [Luteolibacter ambystomatis]
MLALTPLGIAHTAIGVVALIAGIAAFIRSGRIVPSTLLGKVYIWTTFVTAATGFGIYQHGGFGKPHVLGVLTLIALAIAAAAGKRRSFGKVSPYVETVTYTLTFLFHLIPGTVETTTRLPIDHPLVADREGSELQAAIGVWFLLFLIGAFLQMRALRKRPLPE